MSFDQNEDEHMEFTQAYIDGGDEQLQPMSLEIE